MPSNKTNNPMGNKTNNSFGNKINSFLGNRINNPVGNKTNNLVWGYFITPSHSSLQVPLPLKGAGGSLPFLIPSVRLMDVSKIFYNMMRLIRAGHIKRQKGVCRWFDSIMRIIESNHAHDWTESCASSKKGMLMIRWKSFNLNYKTALKIIYIIQ